MHSAFDTAVMCRRPTSTVALCEGHTPNMMKAACDVDHNRSRPAIWHAQAKSKAGMGAEKMHPGVTAAGAGGGVPSATGWQKPAAKSAKKKGKGRKADATMLGFAAGLDYTTFERPET